MDRRFFGFGALAALALQGCSGAAPLSYPQWASSDSSVPEASSGFASYCRAAEMAEQAAGKLGKTVNFTLGKRKQLVTNLGPALRELRTGLSRPTLGFKLTTTGIGESPRYHTGFRLLGRAMVFQIESAIEAKEYGRAAQVARQATQLGFDLCNGSAIDAQLGMSISNEAREAITPALPNLSAKELSTVASQFHQLLLDRPSLSVSIENEKAQMMQNVQSLQDSFLRGDADRLMIELNQPTASKRALADLKSKSSSERLAFFKGFAGEVDIKARHWREMVGLPLSLRDPNQKRIAKLKLPSERPWRVFSDQFCNLGEPLITMNDSNLAQTRLFVLEAALLSRVKSGKHVPSHINGYNDAAIDPYTGRAFPYHGEGKDFRVYSVGTNLIDDGGQSDDSGTSLDMFLR